MRPTPKNTLLKQEPGLIPRLTDQYAKAHDYKEVQVKTRYQNRVFTCQKKTTKGGQEQILVEWSNGTDIGNSRYIVRVFFDPVLGNYKVHIRGMGEEAYDDLVRLAGVEDSAWSELRSEVERGYEDYRGKEPFRRISGINYREADKGKKGDEENKKRKEPKYTSWD